MNNWGSTGITSMILLISFMLIAITAMSIMSEETTSGTTESDIDQTIDEIFDEISGYLQLKDQKGKYYLINNDYKITKIALLISPMISNEIDLFQMNIQLCNNEMVRFLSYDGSSINLESDSLFEQSVWDDIDENYFGFIALNDQDNSISSFDIFNENSDNAYLIIKLPQDMFMQKHDKLDIILFPSTGYKKTISLKAPLPMKSVITFE